MRVRMKVVVDGARQKNEGGHQDEQYQGLTPGQPVAGIFFFAFSGHWVFQKERQRNQHDQADRTLSRRPEPLNPSHAADVGTV